METAPIITPKCFFLRLIMLFKNPFHRFLKLWNLGALVSNHFKTVCLSSVNLSVKLQLPTAHRFDSYVEKLFGHAICEMPGKKT